MNTALRFCDPLLGFRNLEFRVVKAVGYEYVRVFLHLVKHDALAGKNVTF